MAVTNSFLSFQISRLIRFSLAGFNSFLPNYRFILVVFLYRSKQSSFLRQQCFCCVCGFNTMSQLLKAIYRYLTSSKVFRVRFIPSVNQQTLAGYSPWKFPPDIVSPRSANTIYVSVKEIRRHFRGHKRHALVVQSKIPWVNK